jgi:epoxyqueuosine reductase QueG
MPKEVMTIMQKEASHLQPTPSAVHPAVARARAAVASSAPAPTTLTFTELRAMALAAGADDVGVVSLDDPLVDSERPTVLEAFSATKTLIVLVKKMHPDNVRSPARSLANVEFGHTGADMDDALATLCRALDARGVRSVHPAMAFPMEMSRFPGRTWVVSHKVAAHAAGLGVMGLHRNLIHPRFGSFVLLGTVLCAVDIERGLPVVDQNPCIDCKLCVAACPVGAIDKGGAFNFSACYDHNYREFMTGFSDFVEDIADSHSRFELRTRQTLSEQASMWQSLAGKPVYKAAYCVAVCPAGDDVLAPFVRDRAAFVADVVKPLQEKAGSTPSPAPTPPPTCRSASPTSSSRSCAPACGPPRCGASFRARPSPFSGGPPAACRPRFTSTSIPRPAPPLVRRPRPSANKRRL